MKIYLATLALLLQLYGRTQQSFTVNDSLPVTRDGLTAGYSITDASESDAGKKGSFSRYKLRFYVVNNTSEAKLIMYKHGLNLFGSSVSPKLALFKCSNATGARFTNKEATLEARPCVVEALVDEKECGSDKTVQVKKLVNLGYWIKPGETVSVNSIMIVPLNEKPQMSITFYPSAGNMIATTANSINTGNGNYPQQGFMRLKNASANTYLHTQSGPLSCSAIDYNWWSAQWEIIPVGNSNYYNIRNRWKGAFLSTDNTAMLSDNAQSQGSMWYVEEVPGGNTYTIKNAASNSRLTFQNNVLGVSNVFGTPMYAQWVVEQ